MVHAWLWSDPPAFLPGVGVGVELEDGQIGNEARRCPDRSDRDRVVATEGDRENSSLDQATDSLVDSIGKFLGGAIEIDRVEGRDAPATGFDTCHHIVELDMVRSLENRLWSAGRALFPGGGSVIGHGEDRCFGGIDVRQLLRKLEVGFEWIVFDHGLSPLQMTVQPVPR